jgi:predicted transcriptional regulator
MTVMTTIKVSAETRDRLKKLADAEQSTMEAALAKVLDEAEEARFWQGVKDDYARLQADPEEWSDYANELAEWDQTVSDGLDDLE